METDLTPDRVLRRLEWRVLRRLDGRLPGDYRTLFRGEGTEFLDLRDYVWGDDVRRIDWNVTARTNELFVREFMEDREVTAWVLVDRSRSMAFGPEGRTKETVLVELAGTLARLLVRTGNRVGAVVYDGASLRTIPPRQGRNQALAVVAELLRPVAGGSSTQLTVLLDHAARLIRRRSLVVLLSDFISQPGWERPLLRMTERNEVLAIRIVDPLERELPDAGLLVVRDAESGEQLTIDSSDPELRRRLRAAAAAEDLAIDRAVAGARVDLHTISTRDDVVARLVGIAESRRRPRRR